MKVLLASNASHIPPRGGSTRSNLIWLKHLASNGHGCRVVAAAAEKGTREERERAEMEIREQALGGDTSGAGDMVSRDGIDFLLVDEPSQRPIALRKQIEKWQPDWVLVSSEDLGHSLLREAFRSAPGRVVYLAHTPQFFPFGVESWHPDHGATELLTNAAAVVTISNSVARYVQRHVGMKPQILHPPIYGAGPWTRYENWANGGVSMINPCAVKGVSIFLDLARSFPEVQFAALRGWGTTCADEQALKSLPNVTLRHSVKHIDDFLRDTRILLMPSLWYEGFGLIVMEAMLRGIPVIASDYGGLSESALGVSCLAPVNPIAEYTGRFDERHMPVPKIGAQDLGAWSPALSRLLNERETYESVAGGSREASAQFVRSLDAGALQNFLEDLQPSAARLPVGRSSLSNLAPEKRALLLRKLQRKES